MRVDTNKVNTVMRRVIEKAGYTYMADITLTGKRPGLLFSCYEKQLAPPSAAAAAASPAPVVRLNVTPRWSDATLFGGILHFVEVPSELPPSMTTQAQSLLAAAATTLKLAGSHPVRARAF